MFENEKVNHVKFGEGSVMEAIYELYFLIIM